MGAPARSPPVSGRAAEEPLWEVGLGVGVLGYDDYRGADSSHVYPVPVPYVLYNGTFLKTDRDGVHARLFDQDWVQLKLSFNATTPVSNDRTRSGMPDLRPTVEAGISLDFHLWQSGDARVKWDLRMPLRSAFAIESPPQAIGWTFSPSFALDFVDPRRIRRLEAGLPGRTIGGEPPLQFLFLFGPGPIRDPIASRVSGGRRIRRHRISHGALETLPQILGGRLHALRQPGGSRIRGQSVGPAGSAIGPPVSALPGPSARPRNESKCPIDAASRPQPPHPMPRHLKSCMNTSRCTVPDAARAHMPDMVGIRASAVLHPARANSAPGSAGAASCTDFGSTRGRSRSPAAIDST